MKLPIAVLSSILLVCSVTTANPIHPSAAADAEFVSLTDIPSATTDAESSFLTVVPSSTTDAESSFSTAIPSLTTSTEFNPSATPNANGIDLGSLDSLPVNIQDLLKEYSKRRNDYRKHKKECRLIDLIHSNQQSMITYTEQKIKDLKRKNLKGMLKLKTSNGNDQLKELKLELQEGYSKLEDLEDKKRACKYKSTSLEYELKLVKVALVENISGKRFNHELFDKQVSSVFSHPLVKQYLEGLCGGEQSSACSDDSDQDPNGGNFEEISDEELGDEQQENQNPQPQPGSRFFGQRLAFFGHEAPTFRQRASTFRQRASNFGHRAYSGVRNVVSRLGDRIRSLVEQLRCGNRFEC
ncbi:hypothetical protein BATDEDRAFT_91183 [Batrachochytrium dendrobatidis JAM81]|uniref:Uncharacterized protein n=1 Tax=Batrachochytrium dendrobatidis (strain JAM81 / FGSC 10211) TaxID=684364 RepID=F4PAD0_BATDJ|nr:uncharacterized protein BATDEDRAFT_91183 [Batrachochytrium dendrobatidis JAM81]EGF78049.1 hypothetical protein BATDEDRAFT_91183 [Batrachochytrium dendrobatidis JAM81]|eukprot:XP_006681561.1 hypothetical protein BATDEDRAFT_91183 [Batrachochytrium dendrobatidis JAM81]